MQITGKTVLITGAGRRIGHHLAEHLGRQGARIVAHYRSSADEAQALVESLRAAGTEAVSLQAELRDAAETDALVERAAQTWDGGLSVVIACAAVFNRTPWQEVTEADWQHQIENNLTASFHLCRAASHHLQNGGLIVNFGDWAGLRPYAAFTPYCVAKAGVIALSRALAQELAPRLRVNCVCPGTILPPPNATDAQVQEIADNTPLRRIGSPDDIAAAIDFFISSDFTTGAVLPVDGGRLIANTGAYS